MGDALFRLAVDLLHTQFPQPTKPDPIGPVVAGVDLGDECACSKCLEQRERARRELWVRR